MKLFLHKRQGFTLIEMLLVLVIISSIIIMGLNYTTLKADQLRRERTAIQMEQLLNASLAYYVANSAWPPTTNTISALVSAGFLPAGISTNSPYSVAYSFSLGSSNSLFQVSTTTNPPTDAQIIAGLVPLGTATQATVTAAVNIPGQNLNNARAINFAGIYNSTACVPAPTCPANMSPAIYVAPSSVSGVATQPGSCSGPSPSSCTGIITQPINAFVAFARGGAANAPATGGTTNAPATAANVLDCEVNNSPPNAMPCASIPGTDPATTLYWRVCLSTTTGNGLVDPNLEHAINPSPDYTAQQGLLQGTLVVFTRCVPNSNDIPSGTPINIWTYNYGNLP